MPFSDALKEELLRHCKSQSGKVKISKDFSILFTPRTIDFYYHHQMLAVATYGNLSTLYRFNINADNGVAIISHHKDELPAEARNSPLDSKSNTNKWVSLLFQPKAADHNPYGQYLIDSIPNMSKAIIRLYPTEEMDSWPHQFARIDYLAHSRCRALASLFLNPAANSITWSRVSTLDDLSMTRTYISLDNPDADSQLRQCYENDDLYFSRRLKLWRKHG